MLIWGGFKISVLLYLSYYYKLSCLSLPLWVKEGSRNYGFLLHVHFAGVCPWVTFAILSPLWLYFCVSEKCLAKPILLSERPSSYRVFSVLPGSDKVLSVHPGDRMTHTLIIFLSSRTHSFVLGAWPPTPFPTQSRCLVKTNNHPSLSGRIRSACSYHWMKYEHAFWT